MKPRKQQDLGHATIVQYLLKMPRGMRFALNQRAAETGRSVNTVINQAIEEHLEKPHILRRLERLEERMGIK